MELVKILRELHARKGLVALVLGISLLTGFLLAFQPGLPPKSRQYRVAVATSDILVDTRDSRVVTVGGKAPDLPTLTSRADLVANLMTSGPLKDAIAKTAGVDPNELVVVPPANAATPTTPGGAPVPVRPRASLGIPDAKAKILSLSTDETLPILHVSAQAPDVETARKLSGGTIVGLRKYLGSVAASQGIPAAHQLVVRQFGAPLAGTVTRGLPRRYALAATLIVALLGCGAIVGGSWFIRSWKQIEEAESRGHAADESGGRGDENPAATPDEEPAVLRLDNSALGSAKARPESSAELSAATHHSEV